MARFARDTRGVVALEFAVIAPVMVGFIVGTVELTHAFRAQAKVTVAAGQLAELIAGAPDVTAPAGSLGDMCQGAMLNLAPYAAAPFSADIASISNDHPSNRVAGSTDATTVNAYLDWENLTACPTAAAAAMGQAGTYSVANAPQSLLTKSGLPATGPRDLQYGYSAIVVRVTYGYGNVLPAFLGGQILFAATAVARPRTNVTIPCTAPGSTSPCPALQ